jgi:peptide-methionine (S)-S-oxide reductase
MTEERAVLAGGCFWGMQDLIRRFPGVISTRVGYSGGDVPNATYRNHGTHAEAIEVIFDPSKTSFRTLLEFFFQIHDPSTLNRQGNDMGASYRSAIFYVEGGPISGHLPAMHRRLQPPTIQRPDWL